MKTKANRRKMKWYWKIPIWLVSVFFTIIFGFYIWNKYLMYNPKITFYLFKNDRAKVSYQSPMIIDPNSINTSSFPDCRTNGLLEFTNPKTTIRFGYFPRQIISSGSKINLASPILKTLIKPGLSFLKPPKDEQRFENFVRTEANLIFQKNSFIADRFNQGDFAAFCQVTAEICSKHLTYDPATKAWQNRQNGRDFIKISKTNPVRAIFSADNEPVDELLIDKHESVCRHFAETMVYFSQTLKKLYPEKFDNFYFTTVIYPQTWHEATIAYAVTSPNSAVAVAFDLTNYSRYSPAFSLLEEAYLRQIINTEVFEKSVFEYQLLGGDTSDMDLAAFWEFALAQKDETSKNYAKLSLEIYHQHLNSQIGSDYSTLYHYSEKFYQKTGQMPLGPISFATY